MDLCPWVWHPLHGAPDQVDVSAVGAKAHSLMVLHELGLRVPQGVVLAAGAEQACELDEGLLDRLIAELPALRSARLMIRSSGIGEDGASSSFAGQLDSYQVANLSLIHI